MTRASDNLWFLDQFGHAELVGILHRIQVLIQQRWGKTTHSRQPNISATALTSGVLPFGRNGKDANDLRLNLL
jgi:hypothetical protein